MTPEQFERWQDFAVRMARTCFKGRRRPGPRRILACVQEFFEHLDADDIPCIVSWDSSEPYPVGSPRRRAKRTRQCYCQYPDGYMAGVKNPKPDCPHCGGSGMATEWAAPWCVGDMVTEHFKSWMPNYWGVPDEHYEEANDRWCGPVLACLRAGLDCASAPSAGVSGFTAGDLRRMYPAGVPDWVKGDQPWDNLTVKAVVPGVGFVPGKPKKGVVFDKLPDDASIWL